jgi:hypothetical protein
VQDPADPEQSHGGQVLTFDILGTGIRV